MFRCCSLRLTLSFRPIGLALQLLHPEAHYVLHLVQNLEIHVLVGLFCVNLVQDTVFTDVLAALNLEEFGWSSTITLVLAILVTASLCCQVIPHRCHLRCGLLRWIGTGHRSKHFAKSACFLEVLGQLSGLSRLICSQVLLLFSCCIIDCSFRLLLNRLDAEVFHKVLDALQSLMQLVTLRKDHLAASRLIELLI